MAKLGLQRIEKVYDGKVHILKGIELDIADGEFMVLVGPSGCGKSTLLRCIAGLEDITSGSLRIDGRVVNRLRPKDRDCAMVFQSYALYPHMTVRENMGFSLSVRRVKKAEIKKRVEEVAGLLDLSPLLDRLPKQLSGGQRQRVAMGRAIVRNPKVFLFDEPLSNLDASLRTRMRLELKKLHQRLQSTMIYVTHDQVEAMTLADRIAVLESGVLQQVGTPQELFDRPANRFVASFIGSPQMNFFEGVFRIEETPLVSGPGFELLLPKSYAQLSPLPTNVIVGVRPHDLKFSGDFPGVMVATVSVTEPLGWEMLVHAEMGSNPVVAQLPADEAGEIAGQKRVSFQVDPDVVHLFDPDSGKALRPENGGEHA